MSNILRLQKAFKRHGVRVDYDAGVYKLYRDSAHARVLLPASLPLEEKAVRQLLDFASVSYPGHEGRVCDACATPDFHPGSIAPVGAVVATSSDMVIPSAIGTDVNCGMALLSTSIIEEQALAVRPQLETHLIRHFLEGGRDVPASGRAFRALFDEGPAAFIEAIQNEGIWAETSKDRLLSDLSKCIGLGELRAHSRHAPEALVGNRDVLRDPSLGTIGSGNHFVELQIVDKVYDRRAAFNLGIKEGCVSVMVHSGSRDVGFFVGGRWMDKAKAVWPKGMSHPSSGLYALTGAMADEYLEAMGVAARYAWLNRVVLGEMVRKALRDVVGSDDARLVVDVPHNVVLQEQGMNIHRKGSTPAREHDLALIPGSMGDYSFLAEGLGNPDWLWSCSHGAGRAVRRQAMRALKPGVDDKPTWRCVTLKEERKIEEAPQAYKPIGPVISSQEEHGMIRSIARFRPWLTVKA